MSADTATALFQSTRPRGARQPGRHPSSREACFNPRAREGRDEVREVAFRSWRVSIHAPARGATATNLCPISFQTFQSTRPRGARLSCARARPDRRRFQSTRPRGARHPAPQPWPRSSGFNPRAREGRDWARLSLWRSLTVSIHAPARGATVLDEDLVSTFVFQSTRPRGARRPVNFVAQMLTEFQSTRPRGARPTFRLMSPAIGMFQSTRPRGARPAMA